MDTVSDRIYFKDLESRFVRVNRAMLDFLGLKDFREVLGKTDFDFFTEEHARPAFEDEQAIIRTGKPIWSKKEKECQSNGKITWCTTTKVPLRDAQGNIIGTCGISRDVTEQHEAEMLLEKATLEAFSATRAKSEFLAMMSHEIRTPLNGVIGMAGLLEDTKLDPYQKDCVETIHNSGNALLYIINNILDFSKIESGQVELESYPFMLSECIESALDTVGAAAAAKNLELMYTLEQAVPTGIVGDMARLHQILLNLLGNAVKFTAKGEIVVRVCRHLVENGRTQLEFQVHDTGIGIPEDRMDRLFKSFSQIDSSTTRKFGGTGLGLAISRKLVELMGGTMGVTSMPGVGSTFFFTLPCEPATDLPETAVKAPRPELQGVQILIVDDNETNRKILADQVGRWDMIPAEASDGPEALRLLESGYVPDLAILDMQMPGMDGLMLAQRIRQLPLGASLPLAILTSIGLPLPDSSVRLDGYMHKPVRRAQLYELIRLMLRGKQREDMAKAAAEAPARETRVLIAEDNEVNQKVVHLMLQKLGYQADVASDGSEALEKWKASGPYDLLLMDVQMPQLDGYEATRRFREWTGNPQAPWIIAFTAKALDGERERCLEAGMNDYIAKPVRLEDLSDALQRFAQTCV
jgi:PAS domain S-box-containing protein